MKKKPLIFGSGASAFKDYAGLLSVCRAALAGGITAFDTAPSYRTEEVLSRAVAQCAGEMGLHREDYEMQTKIDPIQMYNGNVVEYFKGKLSEMRLDYVDTLLIHWPLDNYLRRTWEEMTRLKEMGLTRQIGICNLRVRHLRALAGEGILPDVLQIERHPLNTFDDEMEFCRNRGIPVQAYSPLCKMHPRIKGDERLQAIASRHNRDLGQILLRWHIDTGDTPIFTSKRQERVALYSHIDGFALTDEDIATISSLDCRHKLYLESLLCPGF